jgi:mannitol-1-phosphate 5-dehydrogenase
MRAVIIGAGRIGRGFLASLLTRNGVKLTFIDANQALVEQMNAEKEYVVHVMGNEEKNTLVKDYEVVALSDSQKITKALTKADFVFTAVGGKHLPSVGELIGDIYHFAYEQSQSLKKVFVTCENWLTPADDLFASITKKLTEEEKLLFEKDNDVTQAVVRASGTSAPEGVFLTNPMDTWVQDYWILPIDKKRIVKNELPNWKYFEFKEDFGNMLYQKIYTNNTSVALIAYLGHLKGYSILSDASNDPEIVEILDEGYREINRALIVVLGVSEESQLEFARVAKEKYQDRKIVDNITRIARDPLRKLSRTDRLIGPAKMCLEAGFEPKALALAIAAALYYEETEDQAAVELKKLRQQFGTIGVLTRISGLDKNDPLVKLILAAEEQLKQKKMIK